MKLRIRGNSLRLRLTQPEVERLARGERIVEGITFAPDSTLEYSVEPADINEWLSAAYSGNQIAVQIQRQELKKWASDNMYVSIGDEQRLGPEPTLRILVEKDFVCLTRGEDGLRADGEDDRDAYPHPNAALGVC